MGEGAGRVGEQGAPVPGVVLWGGDMGVTRQLTTSSLHLPPSLCSTHAGPELGLGLTHPPPGHCWQGSKIPFPEMGSWHPTLLAQTLLSAHRSR